MYVYNINLNPVRSELDHPGLKAAQSKEIKTATHFGRLFLEQHLRQGNPIQLNWAYGSKIRFIIEEKHQVPNERVLIIITCA